jgi:glycine cleavage system H protein
MSADSAIPESLKYSSDHEWIAVDGSKVRMGITDYAQDALGDVVYVQVPSVGTAVSIGDTMSEVESTKSVSDIYAPVTGTIVAVNETLADQPESINSDPYGAGWICEIELGDPSQLDGLLDASGYRSLVEG